MSEEQQFLEKVGKLSFKARFTELIELGKQTLGTEDSAVQARQLLETLERAEGDFYRQSLALAACWGSGNTAFPLQIVQRSSSRHLRGAALELLLTIGNEDELVATLLPMHKATLRKSLIWLVRHKRRNVANRVLEGLLAAGRESEIAELLHFGSLSAVERYFAIFEKTAGAIQWFSLARHHTRYVVNSLQERLKQATPGVVDRQLLGQLNAALQAAAKNPQASLFGVELAQAILQSKLFSFNQLQLQSLVQRQPARMATLLLATNMENGQQTSLRFDSVAHRKGLGDQPELLTALLERFPRNVNLLYSFRKLAPATRTKLFEKFQFGWRDANGIINYQYVGYLSSEARQAEARRNLGLAALQTTPSQRLIYAGFLPWEEARGLLEPYIRNPDPELRMAGLEALLKSIRYERTRLSEGLALVKARKNEQDPVRGVMLRALLSLPPSIWQTEAQLADLGQIIRDALNAADLSTDTINNAQMLVIKILPFQPEWAAEGLAMLVKERGSLRFYNLGNYITERDMVRLAPALDPVLAAWETREHASYILQIVRRFGLLVWDSLADLLERMVKNFTASIATDTLTLLRFYRPDRLKTLVPELLEQDSSWVTQAPVYTYLHKYRQDLLTPYLGQTAFIGRFSTGKTRWVLPFSDGFERWTPAQQILYARTLADVAGDEMRDTPALLSVIDRLAALPSIAPTRLIALASDSRQAVRDKAIWALGSYHDSAQVLPALLECMGDERARLAIYSLRRILLEMPKSAALQILQQVALGKVTVAKEVLRLIGDLHTLEAQQYLLNRAQTSHELHRDVQVALLRSLWEYPEAPEIWGFLEAASQSTEPPIATIAGRMPAERLSAVSRRRLLLVINNLLAHPEPSVRNDALLRCQTMPITDSERILQANLLRLVVSPLPQERKNTLQALLATYLAESDAPLVGEAFGRLLALPDLQPLQQAVQTLQYNLRWQGEQLRPAARQVIAVLSTEPVALRLEIQLALSTLDWSEISRYLSELVNNRAGLQAEVLVQTFEELIMAVAGRPQPEKLAELEKNLASSPDERLRRMGLAILSGLANLPQGWTPYHVERLETYRQDSSLLVSGAARFTFPPSAV